MCIIGRGCPDGSGVVVGCNAGPSCECYCYLEGYCVYAQKLCPFIGELRFKCCGY